jgi:Glycosyl hydrolase family 47
LGGLLASHVAVTESPSLAPRYNGILLAKAQELAQQLLPAFDTATGVPVSWVDLKNGRIAGDVEETCVACAVTMAAEFRLLSHLTGHPIYRQKVDHAVSVIFARRDPTTNLVGNTLWTATGEWERQDAGIGAGADSYYEYLLKTYLIFGDEEYLAMFVDQYASVQRHMAMQGTYQGFSWLLDVHMTKLSAIKGWVSSLSAFWPALQVQLSMPLLMICPRTACVCACVDGCTTFVHKFHTVVASVLPF